MSYTCPVCDYPDLDEEPLFSWEICACCGTEFGYDDAVAVKDADGRERIARDPAILALRHAELRQKWIDGGRKWFDPTIRPDNVS